MGKELTILAGDGKYNYNTGEVTSKSVADGMNIEPVNTFDIVFFQKNEFIVIYKNSFKNDRFDEFVKELFFNLCYLHGISFELVPHQGTKGSNKDVGVFVVYKTEFVDIDTDYFISAIESHISREFNRYKPIIKHGHITEKELKKIKKSLKNAEIVKEYR